MVKKQEILSNQRKLSVGFIPNFHHKDLFKRRKAETSIRLDVKQALSSGHPQSCYYFYFGIFIIALLTVKNVLYNICQRIYLNHRPWVWEATTLPIEPQQLPMIAKSTREREHKNQRYFKSKFHTTHCVNFFIGQLQI